jgi:general secretion pathway protein D
MVQAQESLDDVFAQLDAVNEPGSVESAPVAPIEGPSADDTITPTQFVDAPEGVLATEEPSEDNVWTLYQKGNSFYRVGDYESAERVYDAVLAQDPYNTRAMEMLKRTAKRVSSKELSKLGSTRERAMTDVDAAWNPKPKVLLVGTKTSEKSTDSPDTLAIQQMEARVKGINIPSLDFRDAYIKDVVLFLSETCRSLDADGKGVNILLLGDLSGVEENNITISIRDMSLYEALQYIVEMAELKFEIKSNAIAIMPVGYAPASELILRKYDISPDVGVSMESLSGSDDDGGADDLFGDFSSSSESSAGPMDVAGFFSAIVDFPEGASAEYNPRFQKLFVKNTLNNLGVLEELLGELEDEATRKRAQQVEIEAKFVEFNEGALEELGFDWTMYGNGKAGGMYMRGDQTYFQGADGYSSGTSVAGGGTLFTDPVTGQRIITADPSGNTTRPGQNIFGAGQRNNTTAFDVVQSGILSSMGGSPATMLFSNNDIDLRITAMEQEGTADVLSAPKVTTKSGNEAIIRVVEVHRYPQDWDVETGQKTAPVIKPQDWQDFDLGVVLKVTPVVDAESNTIDLDLQPSILKLKGFDDYKVGSNAYDVSGNVSETLTLVGDNTPLIVKMPYFETRSIQTRVTIADGSTILMGGLVDERTETFRDQVPFLGDIPYLGRLFRTEGSRSQKKNLVIYVKATQVDEYGMTQAERDMTR